MKKRSGGRMPAYLTLMLITLIAGLALGAAYAFTEERIEAQALLAAENARKTVMPEANGFEILKADEKVDWVYLAKKDGENLGYVAQITVQGLLGKIEVIAGVGLDGKITGVSVGGAAFQETPGLGAKIKEKAFTDRFIGKQAPVEIVKAGKAGGENTVDAVASATISSAAVKDAVNRISESIHAIMKTTGGAEK